MKNSIVKSLKSRKWHKKLSAAIAMGLLCGGMANSTDVMAAEYTDLLKSDATAYDSVRQEDGNYLFKEDVAISVDGTSGVAVNPSMMKPGIVAGIYADKSFSIDAGDKSITIDAAAIGEDTTGAWTYNYSASAIYVDSAKELTVTVGDLNLKAKNTHLMSRGGTPSASGLRVGQNGKAVIHGNVNIESVYENTNGNSKEGAFGLYADTGSSIDIDGDLTVKTSENVASSSDTVKGTGVLGKRAIINIGGAFNMETTNAYRNGTYLYAFAQGGSINIDHGSMTYTQAGSEERPGTPIGIGVGNGGIVSVGMNEALDGANGRTVVLEGNIGFWKQTGTNLSSTVNLGLGNSDSKWTGIFTDFRDTDILNLYLENGGTWEVAPYLSEKASGKIRLHGGKDADHAGIVKMGDSDVAIDQYSGDVTFLFDNSHVDNKNTTVLGGNVIIDKATAGSHIVLKTDRQSINGGGINTDSYDVYKYVFEQLANKLTYNEYWQTGINNLNAEVVIAGELTGQGYVIRTGGVQFDPNDGQGSHLTTDFGAASQSKSDFTTTLTGIKSSDSEYADSGVRKKDSYRFILDTNINVDNGDALTVDNTRDGATLEGKKIVAGIYNANNDSAKLTVNSAKQLNINVSGSDAAAPVIGIYTGSGQTTNITGKDIVINSSASEGGTAYGIYSDLGYVGIDGNVTINIEGGKDSAAIRISGKNANGSLGEKGSIAIDTANINVKDARAIWLTQEGNSGGSSSFNIRGGNIIAENSSDGSMGIVAELGDAVTDNGANSVAFGAPDNQYKDINIQGAVIAHGGGSASFYLGTENSQFRGKIYTLTESNKTSRPSGSALMTLKNGAKWYNEEYAQLSDEYADIDKDAATRLTWLYGGDTSDTRGYLYQYDDADIEVYSGVYKTYSGYLTVNYKHDIDDPTNVAGGSLIIKETVKGLTPTNSGEIIISTDSEGIDLSNKEETDAVMNELAQKLYYKDYVKGYRQIKGYAQIAEGLTTEAMLGRFKFDTQTGQGYYFDRVVPPSSQQKIDFTTTIYGDMEKDAEYYEEGVLKEGSGQYVFTLDNTKIEVDNENAAADKLVNGKSAVAGVFAYDETVDINAANKNLMIVSNSTGEDKASVGLYTGNNGNVLQAIMAAAKNLNIYATADNGDAYGIYAEGGSTVVIDGNVSIQANSKNGEEIGIFASRGTVNGAIKNSDVTINGSADITMLNGGTAIKNNGSTIKIGGGTIKSVKTDGGYGTVIDANAGLVYLGMNEARNAAGTTDVRLTGIIDPRSGDGTSSPSSVYLGLGTANSSFNGVVLAPDSYGGVYMYLNNGGSWNNFVAENTVLPDNFAGSRVKQLSGGTDAAHAGIIYQKDSRDITIDSYQGGYTTILYNHDAETPTNIIGGNVRVDTAVYNSFITLRTDYSDNIEGQVNEVLDALANKLWYKQNDNYLSGMVQIAEGLTAASQSKYAGNITFGTDRNSDGYYEGSYEYNHGGETDTQQKDYFTDSITGNAVKDQAYVDDHVLKEGKYIFTLNTAVDVSGAAAVAAEEDVDINAAGKTLQLSSDQTGIEASADKKVDITASAVTISGAKGIAAAGDVAIHGNADITGTAGAALETSGTGTINISGGSKINIAGAVKANGGNITIDGTNAVVNIDGNMEVAEGSRIDVKGGFYSSDYSLIKGDISGEGDASLTLSQQGTWVGNGNSKNLSVELGYGSDWTGSSASDSLTVNLTGNTAVWTGDSSGRDAVVLLANGSKWIGSSTSDNLSLTINGGTWQTTGTSKIKTLSGTNGKIDMSGNSDMTIDSYSGNNTFWYTHDEESPTTINGGSVTITSAAEDSSVTLWTDKSGLKVDSDDASDRKLVQDTLNALAGKLYYTGHSDEQHLKGIVGIAEGLTSQSALKSEEIGFKDNGQGEYVPGGTGEQNKDTFTTAMGGNGEDEYMDANVWKDGTYKFTMGTTNVNVTGSAAISAEKNIIIDAAGKTLNLKSDSAGIQVADEKSLAVDTGELSVTVSAGGTGIASLGTVHVKGTANINTGTNGTALRTLGDGTITLENGTITGNILADGSNITINKDNGSKAVVIKGDIQAANGSVVDVHMNGTSSKLEGDIAGAGEVDLYLSNDASWTGDISGTGIAKIELSGSDWAGNAAGTGEVNLKLSEKAVWTGTSTDENLMIGLSDSTWKNTGVSSVKALNSTNGVIDMTDADADAVTIASYSGETTVLYKHTSGSDYDFTIAGGDVTIAHADAGSVINLVTDSTGVDMMDEDSINSVLDELAQKLYYTGYIGKAEDNLKGYVKIAEGLTSSSAVKQTGDIAFSETTGQGSLKDDSVAPGPDYPESQTTASFDQAITGNDKNDKVYKQTGVLKDDVYTFTADKSTITVQTGAAIAGEDDVAIKADGKALELKGDIGIDAAADKSVSITAKNTEIIGGTGISAAGDVRITGNTTVSGTDAALQTTGSGSITLENATISGAVNAKGGDISLQSGSINGDLIADGGNITVNGNNDSSSVVLTGTIKSIRGSAVTANLGGKASSFTGDVEGNGEVNLNLNNGAAWTGASTGTDLALELSGSTWRNSGDSTVKSLTGSEGVLDMTSNEAGDVTVDKYSGDMVVLYKHNAEADDIFVMNGGDVTIKSAAENSRITLRTDSEGVKMDSVESINSVLEALSNKLFYTGYVDNAERNLNGYVEIAEGLTASSAAKQTGNISYDNTTGMGSLEAGSVRPGVDSGSDDFEIIYGPKETAMMRGAKSAMTTAMLTWRDNVSDMSERLGELQFGAEEGIWARTFGGKAKYDAKNTYYENSFYGLQIGADRKLSSGWYIGGGFDYIEGDSSYELGGSGEPKLYTFSAYGTKMNEDGQYLDLVFKAGRVENDYTVYNDMLHKLQGKYDSVGMGLSAEYGKRFGTADSYIKPELQLTVSRLNGTDYDAVSDFSGGKKMHVSQDGMTSVIGRFGIAAGKTTSRGNVYAKLSLLHEFAGDTKSTYSAENEPTSSVEQSFKDTWAELVLGGTYQLSSSSMLYADFTKSFGGDYKVQYKLNAGLRFTF